jgi:hypothetical protein
VDDDELPVDDDELPVEDDEPPPPHAVRSNMREVVTGNSKGERLFFILELFVNCIEHLYLI